MKRNIYQIKIVIIFFLVGFSAITVLSQDESQHLYGIPNLSFETEMRRLDEAAKILNFYPDRIVYLIGLNTYGIKKSVALQTVRKSKQYLIKKHRISPKRIITAYGRIADSGIEMHIYVVEKNAPSPLSEYIVK